MADDAFDLIQDAFEAIALRGLDGILISDLWPLFPLTAEPTQGGFSAEAVAGARAFALTHLSGHPELRFEGRAGSGCQLSAADVASHAPDAPVTAVASDSAILWALGVDAGTLGTLVGVPEGCGAQAVPQPVSTGGKRMMSALAVIAASGRPGTLQSGLPKRVGCGANYLFYQLKVLEACGVLHRQPVIMPKDGSRIIRKEQGIFHTAVYRLWRLQPDHPPPGALSAPQSYVSQVRALLQAAPDGVLPMSEVRNHFNLRSRKHAHAWSRLKKQVFAANLARPVDVERPGGNGRVHCLQLLERMEEEEGAAQMLDVSPAEQIRAALLRSGGRTILDVRNSLYLRHKHATAITETLFADYGFERRRELSGRNLSWRFLPPGADHPPAAIGAAPGATAPGDVDSETEPDEAETPKPGKGKGDVHFYAVHRRARIVELIRAERAAPMTVLRSLLQQVENRETGEKVTRVDERSLVRHLRVLEGEGEVELREVPWPGKGAGGDGLGASSTSLMVLVPGLDDEAFARVLRNLGTASSMVNYMQRHVRSSVSKPKMPLIKMSHGEGDRRISKEDTPEQRLQLRAEELSLGYIPARAPRARLLHGVLLRALPAHDDAEMVEVSWSAVLEQMRVADAIAAFGLGQMKLSRELLRMAAGARAAGQPSALEAPAASLPPELRQELLHSRLSISRQNELLKILATLGVLTRLPKDLLHVATRAEIPAEGVDEPVVLRLDSEQSHSDVWDRLQAMAAIAPQQDAVHTGRSIHTETKPAAPAMAAAAVAAVNGGCIPSDLLRPAQWSEERPLTNWQRKRLHEDTPRPNPKATPAQVEALAANLQVHPEQLRERWAKEAERPRGKPTKGRKTGSMAEARAVAERVAEAQAAAAAAAMGSLEEPMSKRPRLQMGHAQLVHRGEGVEGLELPVAVPLDAADFHPHAVQLVPVPAVPVEMEWEGGAAEGEDGPASRVKWTDANRAQLLDAYAEQIERMLRTGAPDAAPPPDPPRPDAASPSLSQATAAASQFVDWAALGARLGMQAPRCKSAFSRFLSVPHDATRRAWLRDVLIHRLRASPPPAAAAAAGAGAAAASVLGALGVELDVSGGVLVPRLREAARVDTPREASLRLRLLILLGMSDCDSCPAISKRMLRLFSQAETEAAHDSLRTAGFASLRNKNKAHTGALLYKLSSTFAHAIKGAHATSDGRPFIAQQRESRTGAADPPPVQIPLDLSVGSAAALLEQVADGQLRLSHTTLRPLAEEEAAAEEESHPARTGTAEERRKCASVRMHLIKNFDARGHELRMPRLVSETANFLPRFRVQATWTPTARDSLRADATPAPRFYHRLDPAARVSLLEEAVQAAGPEAREALALLVRAGEEGLTREALRAALGGDGAAVRALESNSLAIEVEMSLGGQASTRLVAQECADIWLHTPYTLQLPPNGTPADSLTGSGLTPVFRERECFVPTWRRHADGSVHTEHVASLRRSVVEWVAARPAISAEGLAAELPALPPHEVVAAAESLVADHALHAVDLPSGQLGEQGTRRLYFAGPHLFMCE